MHLLIWRDTVIHGKEGAITMHNVASKTLLHTFDLSNDFGDRTFVAYMYVRGDVLLAGYSNPLMVDVFHLSKREGFSKVRRSDEPGPSLSESIFSTYDRCLLGPNGDVYLVQTDMSIIVSTIKIEGEDEHAWKEMGCRTPLTLENIPRAIIRKRREIGQVGRDLSLRGCICHGKYLYLVSPSVVFRFDTNKWIFDTLTMGDGIEDIVLVGINTLAIVEQRCILLFDEAFNKIKTIEFNHGAPRWGTFSSDLMYYYYMKGGILTRRNVHSNEVVELKAKWDVNLCVASQCGRYIAGVDLRANLHIHKLSSPNPFVIKEGYLVRNNRRHLARVLSTGKLRIEGLFEVDMKKEQISNHKTNLYVIDPDCIFETEYESDAVFWREAIHAAINHVKTKDKHRSFDPTDVILRYRFDLLQMSLRAKYYRTRSGVYIPKSIIALIGTNLFIK